MDVTSDHFWALIGLVVTVVAAVAAIVVVGPTRRAARATDVSIGIANFRARYLELREKQVQLGVSTLRSLPSEWIDTQVPLLNARDWILGEPAPADALVVRLVDRTPGEDDLIDGRVLRGISLSGPVNYQEAISLLDLGAEYFNGKIYRLVSVLANSGDTLALEFEVGNYFDYLDTSEVLAYEAAIAPRSLGLRKQIKDPFDLRHRVASLGVLTLTIVKTPEGPNFIMHKRSGRFAVGDGLYHVVPAGEFAPSDISLMAMRTDMNVLRNVFREYAEEFLGIPDTQGSGGNRLDYAGASPFRELYEAVDDESLKFRVFGLGLDPLTLKPELLTVAVFESDTFCRIFPKPFPSSFEGVIIDGIPFTEACVEDYLSSEQTRLGAKACLQLAWTHRESLLSGGSSPTDGR